jgi:hypothetical protein
MGLDVGETVGERRAGTDHLPGRASTVRAEAAIGVVGSGKTSCLVGRFVALVESGVTADCIAAITFTEKAPAS